MVHREKNIEICLKHALLSKSAYITKLEPLPATIERPPRIRSWVPQRVSTQSVYQVSHMNFVVLTIWNDSVFIASQSSPGNMERIATNLDG
jgi:hypothetical protein